MTTEEIRKSIHVNGYGLYDHGIKVYYTWYKNRNDKGKERVLILCEKDAIDDLKSMGEIDTDNWDWVADNYIFSQWDALNLVIRYKLAESIEKESGMLAIDKAVENLKKI